MTKKKNEEKAPEISGAFLKSEKSENEENAVDEIPVVMSGGIILEHNGKKIHRHNITPAIAKEIIEKDPKLKKYFL